MCSRILTVLDSDIDEIDINTRIMIEELTEEVQQLFPNEPTVSTSLLTTLYSTAKLNHAKQLVVTMNEIKNLQLRDYLLNVVSILHMHICLLMEITHAEMLEYMYVTVINNKILYFFWKKETYLFYNFLYLEEYIHTYICICIVPYT